MAAACPTVTMCGRSSCRRSGYRTWPTVRPSRRRAPDYWVPVECQGDQQGGEEQQAGTHEGQGVQRDETPSDPFCRGRVKLQGGRCDEWGRRESAVTCGFH